ncbi:cell surface A33 antigen-like isoform X2 [Trachinotus anak]|uniref:cell surface A33 antigen-like isoform X2 n=1 Tax=Trachinotus anak TaxID=443729 RepID=UPI0039F22B3D
MCSELRSLTWTLMLLLLSGVLCTKWKVDYQQQNICAVKGSSVVIPCSFHYPGNMQVQSVMWAHTRNNLFDGPFIFNSYSVNKSTRFQYIGDKNHNCSLKIDQVEHNDAGEYGFRFTTNSATGKWSGKDGPRLEIVDLLAVATQTNGNRTMKEGDSVNLTCINRCDGGNLSSAFTWFKNGQTIREGPVLDLSKISSTNSGNYTCSLTAHNGTTSTAISINVESHSLNSTFTRDTPEVFFIATPAAAAAAAAVTATAALLIVTIVIAVRRLGKKKTRTPETDCEADNQTAVYLNWPVFDNSQSQEGTQHEGTKSEVTYVTVDFNTKRTSNIWTPMMMTKVWFTAQCAGAKH